jgi:hypothetical protein
MPELCENPGFGGYFQLISWKFFVLRQLLKFRLVSPSIMAGGTLPEAGYITLKKGCEGRSLKVCNAKEMGTRKRLDRTVSSHIP